MTKDVLITPSGAEVDFLNAGNVIARMFLDSSDNLNITASGPIRLGAASSSIYIGDGSTQTDLVFDQPGKIYAATGKSLTLGKSDSSISIATKSFNFVTGGSFFGEYDSATDSLPYSTSIAALVGGGNTVGTLIKGRLGGSIVVALHGNDDSDAFVVASYTIGSSPSHSTAPNKIVMKISRQGSLTLGAYNSVGVLVSDGSGNISTSAALSVNRGGTGTGNAPTANKFLIFDGVSYVASDYDQNSFVNTAGDLIVTGHWTFNNIITGSITGNAATATSAVTANSATSAGKWTTARNIALSGAVSGSASIDGAANATINTTLEDVVAPGQYTIVTVDSKGRVIAGGNAGSGDAATLGGLLPAQFLRADIDTTKANSSLSFSLTGAKSFLRAWNSAGSTLFSATADGNSIWLAAGASNNGTDWIQQNSGATGTSGIIRIQPGTGVLWYAASSVGEGMAISSFNIANGVVLWDVYGKIPAANLTGTITSARLTGTYAISISGNAATATTATSATTANTAASLVTGRTISLTGDITGTSAAFDGSTNLSFTASVGTSKIKNSHLFARTNSVSINRDSTCEDSTAWRTLENLNGYSFTTVTDGVVGNNVIRGTNGSAARFATELFALDKTKLYRISFRVRSQASGNYKATTGVQFVDSSGTNIVNGASTYWYYGLNDAIPASTWTQYSFTVGTTGANANITIPSTAIKMAAMVILHGTGTTGYNEVQDIRIEELIYTALIGDGVITGAKIASATLTDTNLTTGSYPSITGVGTLGTLSVSGTVTAGGFSGPLTGNASTATKFATARNITLTGNVTATAVSFDGSADISISTTIASLPAISGANLTSLNASNLGSGIVPSARISGAYTGFTNISYTGQLTSSVVTGTAPFIVASTTLVTNLNAQFLNGQASSAFALASHTHAITDVTGLATPTGNALKYLRIKSDASGYEAVTAATVASDIGSISSTDPVFTGSISLSSNQFKATYFSSTNTDITGLVYGSTAGTLLESGQNAHFVIGIRSNDINDGFYIIDKGNSTASLSDPYVNLTFAVSRSRFTYLGNTIWHAGNDGATSGLDADLLDGQHGAYYLDPANLSATVPSAKLSGIYNIDITGNAATATTATSAGKWTSAKNITVSGDMTGLVAIDGSANASLVITLSNISTAGTYSSVTIDTKGRVTAGTNPTTLAGYGITDAFNKISLTRSITAVVGDTTELGNFFLTYGAHAFIINLLIADTNFSVSKTYNVVTKYNETNNVWFKLIPVTSTGAFNSNDVDVDINIYNATVYLRLRRVGGDNASSAVNITLLNLGKVSDTWTATSATASGISTPTSTKASITSGAGYGFDADLFNGQPPSYYLAWGNFTGKPTTISGYGITDALTTAGGTVSTGNLNIGANTSSAYKITLPYGSAAAPSLTNTTSTGSGFFFLNSGTEPSLSSGGHLALSAIGSGLIRIANSNSALLGRAIYLQAQHSTTTPFGASIGIGGYFDTNTATVTTTGTNADQNGAALMVMDAFLSQPKFSFKHVQSTAAGGAQASVPTYSILELWAPTTTGVDIANYIKITAAATTLEPSIYAAGSDTDVDLVLGAKGAGTVRTVFKATFDSDLHSVGYSGFGIDATNAYRIYADTPNPIVSANAANNRATIRSHARSAQINSGITDSGYRAGVMSIASMYDATFLGTLQKQYAGYFEHGDTSGSGAGTIVNSYGVYIVGDDTGAATITNAYGIYQTSTISGTKNFLGSSTIIGSETGRGSEALYVTGAGKFTSNLAVGGTLSVTGALTLSNNIAEQITSDIYTYRNIAYYAASGTVTGIIKIALPGGWTGSSLRIKVLITNLTGTTACELSIGGYNAPSAWANTSVFSTTTFPSNRVRLAYDGSNCCILLGSTTTAWASPKIVVQEVTVGITGQATFASGWSTSLITSETGLTGAVEPTINANFSVGGVVSDTAANPNTLAQRDSNADLIAHSFRSELTTDTASFAHVVVMVDKGSGVDNYLRPASIASFKSVLGLTIGSNVQAYDAGLQSISGLSGTGVLVATAINTYAYRAIGATNSTDILDRATGDARYTVSASPTFTGKATFGVSVTGNASINVPHGVAPTTPANGDIWTTTSGLLVRINGATQTLLDITTASSTYLTQSNASSTYLTQASAASSYAPLASPSFTGKATFVTPTTSIASITLPHGVAPTTPSNGDVWTTSAGIFVRVNASTKTLLDAASAAATYAPLASPTFTGTVTAPTFSGSLSGNASTATTLLTGRTISLTGNVTGTSGTFDGSGNISFAATIANSAVTYAKIQNVSTTSRLLGRITAGAGVVEELTATNLWTILGTIPDANISGAYTGFSNITASGTITAGTFSGSGASLTAVPATSLTGTIASARISGAYTGITGLGTLITKLTVVAATTATASITIPHGVEPTTPANGDIWSTTGGLFVRINGTTQTLLDTATAASTYLTQTNAASAYLTVSTASSTYAPLASPTFTGTVTAPTFSGSLSGNASTATAWATGRTVALTGDVTGTSSAWAGSANLSFAATIANNAVTYAKIQNVSTTSRLLGRITAGAGVVEELTAANIWTILGAVPNANISGSYTGFTSLTASGTITAATFSGALSGNASTATTLATGRTIALTGDVTGTSGTFNGSANLSFAATIANNAVTYAKIQNISATSRILGRITAGAGVVEELTAANLWTILGTIPDANISGAYTGITNLTASGTITAGTFSGSGASLTALPAANLTGTIASARVSGAYTGITGLGTLTTKLTTVTSSTATASLNVPHGVAPTTPANGDIWTTTSGLLVRINGATRTLLDVDTADNTYLTIANAASTYLTQANASSTYLTQTNAASTYLTQASAASTYAALTTPTFTGKATFVTPTTSIASITLPHGAAPTTPANGDIWTTTGGLFVRINGATKTVLDTGVAASTYAPLASPTFTGTVTAPTFSGSLSGNATTASTAAAFTTGRTITLTGNVTGTSGTFDGSANLSFAATIANNAVTYAKIQNVSATSRVLGRITAGAGVVEELTAANLWTILGVIPDANVSGAYTGLTNITASGTITAGSAVIASTKFVARGGGVAGEGGQIVLGYGNNLATNITDQANNTWNLDVAADQTLRLFSKDNTGAVAYAYYITPDGKTTFPNGITTASLSVSGMQITIDGGVVGAYLSSNLYYSSGWKVTTGTGYGWIIRNNGASGTRLMLQTVSTTDNAAATLYTYTFGIDGTITASAFSGSGASLTSLNASNLASGTVPDARITGAYTGITTLSISGTLTNTAAGGVDNFYLNGATSNWIRWANVGIGDPTFTTRSVGTKIILYGIIGASAVDYAFGINTGTLWSSVPTTSNQFKWFAGTTNVATLSGDGSFLSTGTIVSTAGDIYVGSRAIIVNDTDGWNSARTGSNIDHIWHSDTTNVYHFCSSTTYKATGNSGLTASLLTLGNGSTYTTTHAINIKNTAISSNSTNIGIRNEYQFADVPLTANRSQYGIYSVVYGGVSNTNKETLQLSAVEYDETYVYSSSNAFFKFTLLTGGASSFTTNPVRISFTGAAENTDITNDLITYNSHGFAEGDRVIYHTSSTTIGGLTNNVYYYIRNPTTNTFQLSSTSTGTIINLTSVSTSTISFSQLFSVVVYSCDLAEYNNSYATAFFISSTVFLAVLPSHSSYPATTQKTYTSGYPTADSDSGYSYSLYGAQLFANASLSAGVANVDVIYGIYARGLQDGAVAGKNISSSIYGGYFLGQLSGSTAQTGSLFGSYNYAYQAGASTWSDNIYAAYNYAVITAGKSTAGIYGAYNYVRFSTSSTQTPEAVAVYGTYSKLYVPSNASIPPTYAYGLYIDISTTSGFMPYATGIFCTGNGSVSLSNYLDGITYLGGTISVATVFDTNAALVSIGTTQITEKTNGGESILLVQNTTSGRSKIIFGGKYTTEGGPPTTGVAKWFDFTVEDDGVNDLKFNNYVNGAGSASLVYSVARATGKITFVASTTASATINIAQGSAPTTPANGDIWTTSHGLFAKIGDGQVQLLAAASYTLTDAATVTPAIANGPNFTWTLGATGRTLANPSDIASYIGQSGFIVIKQDATGSRTITTWGSYYKFAGGTKPVLSTAANSIDTIFYYILSSTQIICTFLVKGAA